MNHKYRKKPVVIEAFQMTKERRWDNSDWPVWLLDAWQKSEHAEGALYVDTSTTSSQLRINAREGIEIVSWDDWIVRGIQGELYPCAPDIFEQTYEEEPL